MNAGLLYLAAFSSRKSFSSFVIRTMHISLNRSKILIMTRVSYATLIIRKNIFIFFAADPLNKGEIVLSAKVRCEASGKIYLEVIL